MNSSWRRFFVAMLGIFLVTLTGCAVFDRHDGNDEVVSLDSMSTEELYDSRAVPSEALTWAIIDDLMRKPSAEEAEAEGELFLSGVKAEMDRRIGDLNWSAIELPIGVGGGCNGNFLATGAVRGGPAWKADRVITAAEWDIAVDIVNRAGQSAGFGPLRSYVSGEGILRGMRASNDATRAGIFVGSAEETTFVGYDVTCLLPESVKETLRRTGLPGDPAKIYWPFPIPTENRYATNAPTASQTP